MSQFEIFRKGSPKSAKPDRGGLPARELVLGLDWGTSTTKMVLRDYSVRDERGLGRSYVLRTGRGGSERYPSLVVVHEGRLWFGEEAVARRPHADKKFESLKTSALKRGWSTITDHQRGVLDLHDLVLAALAHMMALGKSHAEKLAGLYGQNAQVEVMLGVPVSASENPLWYAELARRAYFIAVRKGFDPQGQLIDDVEAWIASAESPESGAPLKPGEDHPELDWVRPELGAALFWPYSNPQTREGLYTAVDVGAGTTNISFYRLAQRATEAGWARRGMITFYAGASARTGMNDVDKALAAVLKRDWIDLRGNEAKLMQDAVARVAAAPVIERMWTAWKGSYHAAYRKEAAYDRWDGLQTLVVGGGSLVPDVQKRFAVHPNAPHNAGTVMRDLGAPWDLYEMPAKANDATKLRGPATFLLVAYGLAVRRGDFAHIWLPNEVEDYRPADDRHRRRDIDVDELYPK